ncbi:hypothetical protein EYV94_28385 [Puteibacter caeruleilacunae]|nr:hypothetical protein EYV94_28385 [Puteibacter caeruleilacunae]
MEKMTTEEFNNKHLEYTNRNTFWTDKTISQLGYSINLFTTIGIAVFGYIVTNRNDFPKMSFSLNSEFNLILTVYILAVMLIICSIVFGFISILCRLFDFRITRHLALTRKRFLSKNKEKALKENREKALILIDFVDIANEKELDILKKHIFGNNTFISEGDLASDKINEKFQQLKKESKILGNLTWKLHRFQIGLFLLCVFFYGLTILR